MLKESKGLKNLALIDESVRLYVYLILTSQISSRSNIDSFEAKKIYKNNFENAINRSISTQQDIARYQQIITQARSKVDFPIAYGTYMMPSDMSIINGKTNDFNNKILISNTKLNIGSVNDINISKPETTEVVEPKHALPQIGHPIHRYAKAKEHNDEILSLVFVGGIIGIIALGGFIYYRYKEKMSPTNCG